jgi:acetone carboxylase gamma subunit
MNRKLIVDIRGDPITSCCGRFSEFAKNQDFYLCVQIRDIKRFNPTNPCLLTEDNEGHRFWHTFCPFCGADIEVEWTTRKEFVNTTEKKNETKEK